MRAFLARLVSNETGATSIEYALVASLIAVVIVGALTTVGSTINSKFFTDVAALTK